MESIRVREAPCEGVPEPCTWLAPPCAQTVGPAHPVHTPPWDCTPTGAFCRPPQHTYAKTTVQAAGVFGSADKLLLHGYRYVYPGGRGLTFIV